MAFVPTDQLTNWPRLIVATVPLCQVSQEGLQLLVVTIPCRSRRVCYNTIVTQQTSGETVMEKKELLFVAGAALVGGAAFLFLPLAFCLALASAVVIVPTLHKLANLD